jgi:hypothetical protein
VSLVFLGMDRPLRDPRDRMSAGDEAVGHARARGVDGTAVHFRAGWVPYAERGRFLAAASIGLCTHHDHLEARFSFRTRLLDCIWARLPIACTGGDALGDLVEHEGLGATAPPGDSEALATACAFMLEDDARAASARAALDRLAPRLTWKEVTRPLREYCTHLADLPPLARNDSLLRSATFAQYPRIAREVLDDRGASAAARKLAVNAARAARERMRRT